MIPGLYLRCDAGPAMLHNKYSAEMRKSMCQYCYNRDRKEATSYTLERNRQFAQNLGLVMEHCTNEEYELAKQKCIYPANKLVLKAEDGHIVWDLEAFSFFDKEEVPSTVNPSLWMNGKSNYLAGVFEVVKDAIYQVRGFDIANLTIIRSKTGWIVQDVMTTVETSRAALELLEKALGEEVISRIRAVIISHSHADHFGGIRGVVSPEQVGPAAENKIPVYVRPDLNSNVYGKMFLQVRLWDAAPIISSGQILCRV